MVSTQYEQNQWACVGLQGLKHGCHGWNTELGPMKWRNFNWEPCTCWSNRAQNIGSGMYSTRTRSTILISWMRRFCQHTEIQTHHRGGRNHQMSLATWQSWLPFVTEYFSSAQSNQCDLCDSNFDLCQRLLMANCRTESGRFNTLRHKNWREVKKPGLLEIVWFP